MAFRFQYNSKVVLTFSILCGLVFMINYITRIDTGVASDVVGRLTPYFMLSADFNFSSLTSYITMFTYVIGHANSNHLMGNLTFILLLGPVLEEKYGSSKILFMMIFTALITAIIQVLLFDNSVLGASGIVFMMIVLVSFTNVKRGRIPITFILILILFIGKEIINGFETNSISEFGHIMGGFIGSLFGFTLMKDAKAKPELSK